MHKLIQAKVDGYAREMPQFQMSSPDLLFESKFFECDNLIPEIGILAPCQLLSNNNRWLFKKKSYRSSDNSWYF